MFCSACGYENKQEVNFCKRCGANLTPAPVKTASTGMVGLFLAAIALITVIGFIGPMVMVAELSHKGMDEEPLVGLAFFFLTATTIIDWLLLRLLTRLLGFSKQKTQQKPAMLVPQPKYVTAEQPYPQLPEAHMSMPSVTEHTTRNFEPIISRESRNRETS
jgi:hypothetical protein